MHPIIGKKIEDEKHAEDVILMGLTLARRYGEKLKGDTSRNYAAEKYRNEKGKVMYARMEEQDISHLLRALITAMRGVIYVLRYRRQIMEEEGTKVLDEHKRMRGTIEGDVHTLIKELQTIAKVEKA